MCGIAGVVSLQGSAEPAWIRSLTAALTHRGPDDEGYLAVDLKQGKIHTLTGRDSRVDGRRIEDFQEKAGFFLGHRRLSIIDLSPSGHQPMSSLDGTVWIIYNGEIYNYIELRAELAGEGFAFRTETDTEVILAAYKHWGSGCLSRFNGMWAFVLYDRRQNILFGSRDPFGVKPLYFHLGRECFAFASEIKALLTLPFIPREFHPATVFDYLVIGLEDHGEETMFSAINELPPASTFTFNLNSGQLRTEKYFRLTTNETWERLQPQAMQQYVANVRERIFSAVRLRLRSDVSVGSLLSGGLDSSSIVCLVDKILREEKPASLGDRQRVYTASYRDNPIDESEYARAVVEKTRSEWHRHFPDANSLLRDLEDLAYTQDLPFGSTSIYAHYGVCRLAAQKGTKVLLDGQGGDEIFAGYREFYRAFFLQMLKNGDLPRFIREWLHLHNAPIKRMPLVGQMGKSLIKRILPGFARKSFYRRRYRQNRYLQADFWKANAERISAYRGRDFFSLNRMLAEFQCTFQLKTLLRYEDRNSMRFSLESRAPYADDIDLIEYLFSLPASYKIVDGCSKYLLREATKDLLPASVAQRRDKIGFMTPEFDWLRLIGSSLLDYFTPDLEVILDLQRVKQDWGRLMASQPRIGITPLWRLVSFAVWKKVFKIA